MKALCIIPCGKKKIWDQDSKAGPTRAKDVYIGPFARKCQEYARTFYPESWRILSAKYGFLRPKDILPEPYNVSFNDKKTSPVRVEELLSQAEKQKLSEYEQFVVLGGKNYVSIIRQIFGSEQIKTPLSGCSGIGYMMKRLNDAINKGVVIQR